MASVHSDTTDMRHIRPASTLFRRTKTFLLRGAFDTHVHIFDPRLGPYAAGRSYTPEDAPLEKLLAFNQTLSTGHRHGKFVLVQPSPYKTDCTVLLKSLQELRRRGRSAYGIAVIDVGRVTDFELDEMHRQGVRGIRLNFQADGKPVDAAKLVSVLRQAGERIRHLPRWMIQLFVPGWTWDVLYDTVQSLPVVVIADHLGGMLGASKLDSQYQDDALSQPGLKALASLARQSRVVVKLSGLYRVSNDTTTNFSDVRTVIQALANEAPDQIIWGSDWPHTGEGHDRLLQKDLGVKEPFRDIDDNGILQNLTSWLGEEKMNRVLKENPARIFK